MFNYKYSCPPDMVEYRDLLHNFFTTTNGNRAKCRFCAFTKGTNTNRDSPYAALKEEDFAVIKAHVATHDKVLRCGCGVAFANSGGIAKCKKTLQHKVAVQERSLEKQGLLPASDLSQVYQLGKRPIGDAMELVRVLDIQCVPLEDGEGNVSRVLMSGCDKYGRNYRWFVKKEIANAINTLLFNVYASYDKHHLAQAKKFIEDMDILMQSVKDNNLESFHSLLELRHL